MAVHGLVRLRKHLFGRQQVVGTKVAATLAYPYKGVPTGGPVWADQDVDAGALDVVAAPTRGPEDNTPSLTEPALCYNCLPQLMSGFFGGNVDATGAGPDFLWSFAPASEAPLDELDYHTYSFGDDVLDDWYEFGDGFIESLDITGPDGLGALTASANWRFGSWSSTGSTDQPASGGVPAALTLDTNAAIVYLKDGAIFIASSVYDLGTSQISNALHTFTLRFAGDVDQKRWANGTQSFDVNEFVRTSRSIELECTFAKTDDIVGLVSESDAWMSDTAVTRYVRMTFTSKVEADTGTFYSWTFTMPMRYYTRTESEIGGNTVVVLTGHAFFDPDDLDGVFTTEIVNTIDGADLGSAGS
jgi:hypothetical protein